MTTEVETRADTAEPTKRIYDAFAQIRDELDVIHNGDISIEVQYVEARRLFTLQYLGISGYGLKQISNLLSKVIDHSAHPDTDPSKIILIGGRRLGKTTAARALIRLLNQSEAPVGGILCDLDTIVTNISDFDLGLNDFVNKSDENFDISVELIANFICEQMIDYEYNIGTVEKYNLRQETPIAVNLIIDECTLIKFESTRRFLDLLSQKMKAKLAENDLLLGTVMPLFPLDGYIDATAVETIRAEHFHEQDHPIITEIPCSISFDDFIRQCKIVFKENYSDALLPNLLLIFTYEFKHPGNMLATIDAIIANCKRNPTNSQLQEILTSVTYTLRRSTYTDKANLETGTINMSTPDITVKIDGVNQLLPIRQKTKHIFGSFLTSEQHIQRNRLLLTYTMNYIELYLFISELRKKGTSEEEIFNAIHNDPAMQSLDLLSDRVKTPTS